MSGGQVWVSKELIIVDSISKPPHGFFNNCGVLGGPLDIVGLGGLFSKEDPKMDEAGSIWGKALWARGNSVSLLMCFHPKSIDI